MGRAGMAWGTAAIVALALGAGACQQAREEAPRGVTWIESMDAALADAQKTNRPILLDFYTDW